MRSTSKFTDRFLEIEHYQMHSQMQPFVGEMYEEYGKLLIIGESHYLRKDADNFIIENWYKTKCTALLDLDADYTSTRNIVESQGTNQYYKCKAHYIYKNIELAVLESGFNPTDTSNMFRYMSFMNFFQRPAKTTGDSIIPNSNDIEYANYVVKKVINIIEPKYIFFTSSKAWASFEQSIIESVIVGHSCHPTCQWWNRKNWKYSNPYNDGQVTGKESFIKFLKFHEIFKTS
jgi:hypothetical protein